ncbi:MAG: sugar porter family MFS transporter [Caulobacteraceae bacterium]
MSPVLLMGVVAGALSGLLFGFDTAVIAGTTAGLTSSFHLSAGELGFTVSSALWGTLAGALLAGKPGDRFGARACLKAIALLYVVSGVGCFLAWNWPALLVFRVVAGLAIGASSVLAPVYIAEIAPARWRGAMVGAFQLNIVLGILIAYLSNAGVAGLNLGPEDWRWKFAATLAPSLLLLGFLYAVPQSPRWLALAGRLEESGRVLRSLGSSDPEGALAAIVRTIGTEGSGARERLSWRRHRRPILLALAIAGFNQLSGINAILYYLNDIFAAAGFSAVSADQQSIIIGAMNLAFTLLALTVIDRLGRKTLLMIGSVGLVASLAAASAILLTNTHQDLLLWALVGFIASFAFSQGAVIWVYISEIFPTEVRARGQSIGASTHWFMDAVIATAFPVVAATSKGAPFVLFTVMMVAQFVVVLLYFPETKQATLEEIGDANTLSR